MKISGCKLQKPLSKKGKLYLLPNSISEYETARQLNPHIGDVARELNYFICEHAKNLRAFLKRLSIPSPYDHLEICELNKHTDLASIPDFLKPTLKGYDMGLVSDAGCPGVADPGADVVKMAHGKGVEVVPLVGPSSILLALMASGLNGQKFSFNGYLPQREHDLKSKLRGLEVDVVKNGTSHIFIETPYRNEKMFGLLLKHLDGRTLLCLGIDIMGDSQTILTKRVGDWRQSNPDFNRLPTVFIIGC